LSEATTYRPTTEASISSPPSRLNSRNFTAAYERRTPPKPPIRK
jgi:hypothetical protein